MPSGITSPGIARPWWPSALSVRRPRFGRLLYQAFRWLAVVSVALASYFVTSRFFFQTVQVVGPSMSPALENSQRYMLNRWIYWFRGPRRADVVVIREPVSRRLSVKRVVASPGDWLYLQDGNVWVNGRKLDEPYLPALTRTFPEGSLHEQWLRCGKDQYVVLGDNRKNSSDSRSYGPVARRDVLGRIFP